MTRRIDIELTSRRDDGSWTWRAPGARQPRGEVDGSLLPEGAKIGDVLRADAEFEIEVIVVTGVFQPRAAARADAERRIEVLGSGRTEAAGVSVTLAPGSRRRRDDEERPRRARRHEGGSEDGRTERARTERVRTEGRQTERAPTERAQTERTRTEGRQTERAQTERAQTERGRTERGRTERTRPAGSTGPADSGRAGRGPRAEREPSAGDRRPSSAGGRPPAGRQGPGQNDRGPRPRRAQPATAYRNAALGELRPEQLPVAEQLLRGGIPAVRQAIEEQNTRATAEGRTPVSPEPLLALAEELLPKMNLAVWMDRATAIRGAGKDAPLREVRSVVAAASALSLDDQARTLLTALREALETRVKALRESWLGRITTALDEHRVADALRIASRAPEPAALIPAEMAVRLAATASTSLSPELPEADWLALLEAVVTSPVRRTVKPTGLPRDPSEQLLQTARRCAGQVPELARLLGLPIPPPPGPRRPSAAVGRRG